VSALSALTVYFGERDRVGSRLRADALMQACEDRSVRWSVLLRGAEGFGAKHAQRTDRLLTLSEDLPMVLVAIDEPAVAVELAADLRAIGTGGLATIEQMTPVGARPRGASKAGSGAARVSVIVGRRERVNGGFAHELVVEQMRAAGMHSATALLGVDGTVAGERTRARFFARNSQVPMMILGVGERATAESAVEQVAQRLPSAPITLQEAHICERSGGGFPVGEVAGGGELCRLSVYAGEDLRHGDRTLHEAIVRALRRAGAPGASTLRGQWGYDGPGTPSGERIAALGRHAPMITSVIDTPEASAGWLAVLHEMAGPGALITSEQVHGA
jgi:PII-like signaling protein